MGKNLGQTWRRGTLAKKPETNFKDNKVRPFLKSLPNTWFFKTNERAVRGIPDFILCINGMFVAIELKKDKASEPDELQKFTLKKIKDAKGISFVTCPEDWLVHSKVLTKLAGNSTLMERGSYEN